MPSPFLENMFVRFRQAKTIVLGRYAQQTTLTLKISAPDQTRSEQNISELVQRDWWYAIDFRHLDKDDTIQRNLVRIIIFR